MAGTVRTWCYEEETFAGSFPDGGVFAAGSEFYQCRFQGGEVTGEDWSGVVFEECVFESCSLTALRVGRTGFRETAFHGARLSGIDFSVCDPFSLRLEFRDCLLQGCDFSRLRLDGQCFHGCRVIGCHFNGTVLAGADFGGAELTDTRFLDCDLRGTDFRQASGYGIDLGRNRVAGAKFSLPEAVALLRAFELELE